MQEPARRDVSCPMTVSTEVLAVLADVLQTREVYDAPDLPLYELDLLDSLRTVELILALSERFSIGYPRRSSIASSGDRRDALWRT